MSFGETYASIYDELYKDKAYGEETNFVTGVLRRLAGREPNSLLDLGCGTGKHAEKFAETGISIEAFDLSESMISIANRRRELLAPNVRDLIHYGIGDARSLSLGRTFEAVTLLFHVMSYMTTDNQVDDVLAVAREHLEPGGFLLFDFWYGPAVVAMPPERRSRLIRDKEQGLEIERRTLPSWDKARNTVCIKYEIETRDAGGRSTRTSEEHVVRYFFDDGIEASLTRAGFRLHELREWLSAAPPTEQTFGVYAAARRL